MNIWTGCLQCVPDSLRSHLGAANADIDHIHNTVAAAAQPTAVTHSLCKIKKSATFLRHLRVARSRQTERAQRRMERRTSFTAVDALTTDHPCVSSEQIFFSSEFEESLKIAMRESLTRKIKFDAASYSL